MAQLSRIWHIKNDVSIPDGRNLRDLCVCGGGERAEVPLALGIMLDTAPSPSRKVDLLFYYGHMFPITEYELVN